MAVCLTQGPFQLVQLNFSCSLYSSLKYNITDVTLKVFSKTAKDPPESCTWNEVHKFWTNHGYLRNCLFCAPRVGGRKKEVLRIRTKEAQSKQQSHASRKQQGSTAEEAPPHQHPGTGYRGYLCLVAIPSTSQRKEKWLANGEHKHHGSHHDIIPERPQLQDLNRLWWPPNRCKSTGTGGANQIVPDSRVWLQMVLENELGAGLLLCGRVIPHMPKTSSSIPSNAETKQKIESKCFSYFCGWYIIPHDSI